MARTVCGREDRANRSPAWTRRERCGRPRPCRTRHRAPRAGRGCGRMRQVGVHHHDPVEPVACDTLEDATVQIGPGPSAHLNVHGQGPTSRAETTGVSSSESSSTSSSSHAMARPAMAPATRSAKQLEARGLSALRAVPLRTLRYRSGRAPRRTSMCTDRGQRGRAETTGVSSSESSSTSSSSHAMARPAMAPVTRSAKQLEARGLSQRRHRDLQRRVVVRSGKAASCRAFETRRAAWQAAAGGRRGATIGGDDHLQGGDRLAETVRNKHRRHDDPLRKSAREATMSVRLRLRVSVVVEADGDGYHAYCPAFKGLHAAGETEDDAIEGLVQQPLRTSRAWRLTATPYRWAPIARSQRRART